MRNRDLKIAHLTTDDHGGVSTVVANLMSAERVGVTQEAVIAQVQHDGHQRLSRRLASYVTVPTRRLSMARWLMANGRRYDAFVIHKVSWSFWYGLLAGALRLPPAIHVIHDMELLTYTGGAVPTLLHRYFRSERAAVMTVAPTAARRLQDFYRKPVGYLPQPIPLQEVPRIAKSSALPLRVLYLARMDDLRKDLGTLLHAAARMIQTGRSVEIIIGGAGYYEAHWQGVAKELNITDHAHFLGPVTDLASFLARGDVFVFSSTFPEGLPMTILEAVSFGLPVILSTTTGHADLERQGRTFAPGDIAALADQLSEAYDLVATHGTSALSERAVAPLAWVRKNYSPEAALEAYLQAIIGTVPLRTAQDFQAALAKHAG